MEGRIVGKMRVICTGTKGRNTKNVDSAGFNCSGIARLPGGTLVLEGEGCEGPTEGAITGGTGIYAGSRGTFISGPNRGFSTITPRCSDDLRASPDRAAADGRNFT